LQACLLRWQFTMEDNAADLRNAPPLPQVAPAVVPVLAAAPTPLPPPLPLLVADDGSEDGTPGVLDSGVLDELQEVIGAETANIIGVFLEDTPPLIRQLQDASVAGDLEKLRALAHSLKSASANVGAMALSVAARRIEHDARAGTLERPAVAVALLIAEYARARLALAGYQASVRATAAR
ncbi:MAG: Hpt domain-containing protein, partial [Steroidobacteraceae bacterium]